MLRQTCKPIYDLTYLPLCHHIVIYDEIETRNVPRNNIPVATDYALEFSHDDIHEVQRRRTVHCASRPVLVASLSHSSCGWYPPSPGNT